VGADGRDAKRAPAVIQETLQVVLAVHIIALALTLRVAVKFTVGLLFSHKVSSKIVLFPAQFHTQIIVLQTARV
jgi:hypothetical protein